MKNPNEEIDQIANNPCTPYWIKDIIRVAMSKDCVDVVNALDALAKAFERRLKIIQGDK